VPQALGAGRAGEGIANAAIDSESQAAASGSGPGSFGCGSLTKVCVIARLRQRAADPAMANMAI
jgi:hypothetical protein